MAQTPPSPDSFGARSDLTVGDRTYEIFRIRALADRFDVDRLPYSVKVILENLLRHEDGISVTADDIEAVAAMMQKSAMSVEDLLARGAGES